MIVATTVSISGQIHGALWMPNADGYVDVDVRTDLSRFVSRPTLRQLVDHVMTEHGGDFRDGGRLTADTLVTIQQHRSTGRGTVKRLSRTYDAADLASIADFVGADSFMVWPDDGEATA